jgi:hypothetical protein
MRLEKKLEAKISKQKRPLIPIFKIQKYTTGPKVAF